MNCTECHNPIPAGMAVIRSVSFEQVAWHRECYAWQLLPRQREGSEVRAR